jgi:opacity protein-like surface antigen
MRTIVLSLAALASISTAAAAQATSPRLDSVTTGGIAIVQSRPQGALGRNTGQGYGIAGTLFFRVDDAGILSMRVDVGGLAYGNESKRTPLSGEIGGRVQVRTSTTNYIVPASIGPQITWPTGAVRPYVTAGVGGQGFFAESSVEGTSSHVPFASTTNQWDASALWTAGSGVYVRLIEGRVPVMLDLGVQYIDGGRARYLAPGSIEDLPDGGVRITPFESRTQMMLVRLGARIGR